MATPDISRVTGHADIRDPGLPLPERVASLLAHLTLDEKIAMMHQYSPGVPRLGIPPLVWGLPVRRAAEHVAGATVFPQSVSLGATWDTDLIQQVGSVTGTEARAGCGRRPETGLSIWGPVVNLLRDPRRGRNEEGYSECPRLTSDLATAMCRGLSGQDDPVAPRSRWKTTPVLQHFLAYNHENERATRLPPGRVSRSSGGVLTPCSTTDDGWWSTTQMVEFTETGVRGGSPVRSSRA